MQPIRSRDLNSHQVSHLPPNFSSSQRRLESRWLSCGRRGFCRSCRGGASAFSTIALVTGLVGVPRWRVGVSTGQDGGRGHIVPTGDGCVELTGKRRRCSAAPSGHQRNCPEKIDVIALFCVPLSMVPFPTM